MGLQISFVVGCSDLGFTNVSVARPGNSCVNTTPTPTPNTNTNTSSSDSTPPQGHDTTCPIPQSPSTCSASDHVSLRLITSHYVLWGYPSLVP